MAHLIRVLLLLIFLVSFAVKAEDLVSHLECKAQGGTQYRPFFLKAIQGGTAYEDYSKKPKGLLGQNAMKTLDECGRAIDAANHEFGVVCSRTGLDGWKPTLYTGTVPGRPDFGYMGGSSISKFEDCLRATRHSSARGVCFWGGSQWFVSPIDKEGLIAGPFATVDDCIIETEF